LYLDFVKVEKIRIFMNYSVVAGHGDFQNPHSPDKINCCEVVGFGYNDGVRKLPLGR